MGTIACAYGGGMMSELSDLAHAIDAQYHINYRRASRLVALATFYGYDRNALLALLAECQKDGDVLSVFDWIVDRRQAPVAAPQQHDELVEAAVAVHYALQDVYRRIDADDQMPRDEEADDAAEVELAAAHEQLTVALLSIGAIELEPPDAPDEEVGL